MLKRFIERYVSFIQHIAVYCLLCVVYVVLFGVTACFLRCRDMCRARPWSAAGWRPVDERSSGEHSFTHAS